MPKFKFEEMEKEASVGRLFPVYIITGSENYLVKLLTDKIRSVYQAETGAEVERYSAQGIDAGGVIDGLKTLPMWSKGKLVIIDEAGKLSKGAQELLLSYVGKPSPSSILIFVSEKFDGRSALYQAVSKNGAVVAIDTIYENQMPSWINRECKNSGYAISKDAANFMTELVGANLSAMSSAVEKIILYIGSKKLIDLKDVETVLADTSQKSIFDFTKAVGSKDLSLASARLKNLLNNNEPPVVIVSMIARHWRLLLKAKELMENGLSEYDIASKFRLPPMFTKEYIFQSKGFTKRELVRGFGRLMNADKAVKSSKLPKEAILNRLIIDLIH